MTRMFYREVDRSFVSRMQWPTSLAPDIVEAVLSGEDLQGLSLRQLRKEIPLVWEEQRKLWA